MIHIEGPIMEILPEKSGVASRRAKSGESVT